MALGQSLHANLNRYLGTLPPAARVSLAVRSLADTTAFYQRADERLPSASLIKLPIMVEAMEAVRDGRLNPDEIYILQDSDKVGGSGVLQTYQHRSRIAYRDLITLMMTLSDNTATNILLRDLGMKAVNDRMRTLGLTQSQLNRMMMDTAAVARGVENYVTARELNGLLVQIYRGQVGTAPLCEQMLDILKRNEDTLTIPRLLPKTVAVAHKTGTLAYVRGDAGIVYARRPFVLSVLVQGLTTAEAERVIGELAAECFAVFNR
ncbi:serine hydrolase [Tellurirhabdus rosea]|uniref:serine hydrolase n=1 Tax=Tellurirhabdus rosea TaxID=2674997 RepID=UPI0022526A32|nr:serine hydrolase [Tellurirhabdus rosea]